MRHAHRASLVSKPGTRRLIWQPPPELSKDSNQLKNRTSIQQHICEILLPYDPARMAARVRQQLYSASLRKHTPLSPYFWDGLIVGADDGYYATKGSGALKSYTTK